MGDIGARIRQARMARGIGQEALAAAIGATKSTISKIESGARKVEGGELAELADVLGVSMRDLIGRRQALAPLALAQRLGAADPTSPSAVGAKRRVQRLLELEAMLDELEIPAEAPRPSWESITPSSVHSARAGRDAAEQVRAQLGLGDAPVADLASLLEERFGIDVAAVPLGDGPDTISGLCVRSGNIRIALVNSSKVPTHQRFTLAHELAHLLFDDLTDEVHVDEHVDADGDQDAREIRANAFAAAFLVPEHRVTAMTVGDPITDALFANLLFAFDVSVAALTNRMESLGLASPADAERWRSYTPRALAWQYNRVDEWRRSNEPRYRTRPPTRLHRRAIAAYRDGRTGIGPLAGLIDRDEDELLRELDEAGVVPNLADDSDVLALL